MRTHRRFSPKSTQDPEVAQYISREELEKICNVDFHFRNVDMRFKMCGIE